MRRLMFIGLAVVLLAGLAGGQVIKFSVSTEDSVVLKIGDVVKLNADDEVKRCGYADSVIGFVAMMEYVSADTLALIVNAGPIKTHVTEAVNYGAKLTPDAANPGELKNAGVGDRSVAIALETIGAAGDIKVMIQLDPITTQTGAKKWQIYDAGPTEYDLDATDIFSDYSSTGGVDVAALDFYFTCTIDDHGSSGSVTGTVANFAWDITGLSTSSAPGATVYLLDRHFYQSQTVAMQATDMDPSATDNFTVNVNVTEGLGIDGTGRITNALLTVVGTPRTAGP